MILPASSHSTAFYFTSIAIASFHQIHDSGVEGVGEARFKFGYA